MDVLSYLIGKNSGGGGGTTGLTINDIVSGAEPSGHVTFDVENLKPYAFSFCENIESIHGTANNSGQYIIENCSCKIFVVEGAFRGNYNKFTHGKALQVFDAAKEFEATFSNGYFNNCTALTKIILHKTNGITVLASGGAFNNTPFASGGTGGTLYVPQALIADYQSAANWSTLLGYANNQILPIEGSIYETQYADGTPVEGG